MKTPYDLGREVAVDYMAEFYPDREWAIVGGMLRDEVLGVPYKDIDIFVHGYDTDLLPEGAEDGEANAYLLRAGTVTHLYAAHFYEINLIFMRGEWTMERLADRCDLGFCQIAWVPAVEPFDLGGIQGGGRPARLYKSEAFDTDIREGTMTLYRATSRDHVDRMIKKFPQFEYKNPRNIDIGGKVSWEYIEQTQSLDKIFKLD